VSVGVGAGDAVGVTVTVIVGVEDGEALGEVLTSKLPSRVVARTRQPMAASKQSKRSQSISLFKSSPMPHRAPPMRPFRTRQRDYSHRLQMYSPSFVLP
jgi:hypothetical protein